jgi:hypothetical protein
VFAYGATGAGKTFTMLGSKTSPGITYLTIVELYRQMEIHASEREFDLAVSHLEVSHYLLAYHLYCIILYSIHKLLQNDIGHVQRVVTVNSIRITVKANKHVNLI